METTVTVIDLLKQLAVAIPLILVATQTITAAIHGAFHIKSDNLNHAISWIVAVLSGLGFVAFNKLDFGLPTAWNYVLGGVAGLITGGTANGWYDWPLVKKIIDAITDLFGGNKRTKKIYITTEEAIKQCNKGKNSVIPSEFLSVFPNNFGINLCAVKGFDIETTSDNQYKTIRIDFLPTKEE
ncbi:MAG: hypothetical protein IKJ78_06205 [Bacteroidales bacterium]|nr:hypothetical protein [Bacteroidales bacterium]